MAIGICTVSHERHTGMLDIDYSQPTRFISFGDGKVAGEEGG